MADVPVGSLFVVTETLELWDGEGDGDFVGRYMVEYGPYRVTNRNVTFVNAQIDLGKAVVVGSGSPYASPAGLVE